MAAAAAVVGGAGDKGGAEVALPDPPKDGISSARWAPAGASQDLLVAASWDSKVHVYDTAKNVMKVSYAHKAPVLDATFVSADAFASGGLDMDVKLCVAAAQGCRVVPPPPLSSSRAPPATPPTPPTHTRACRFDLATSTMTRVGRHDAPVRTLEFSPTYNLLFSGSWDSTCNAWDLRTPGEPVYSIVAPGKVYSSSLAGPHMLLLATAGRRVEAHDLRKISARDGDSVLLSRETNLKHQTRCIRAMVDGSGYIVSSIEGRCGVEWIDAADNTKKYAFKCHRFKMAGSGEDRIFPVNALAFHPVFGTFLTGAARQRWLRRVAGVPHTHAHTHAPHPTPPLPQAARMAPSCRGTTRTASG